jgi:hypothetical protein
MQPFSQILRFAGLRMTGRIKASTHTSDRTWIRFRSGFRRKLRSLALALPLVAGGEIAAFGQAPAGEPSGPVSSKHVNSGQGDSQVRATNSDWPDAHTGRLGSLSGKLTDLHSTPLNGATVVLRNAATGAEARAVTQKNGSYRFTGIPAGEYTLAAESSRLGQGSLEGILVSAGTEARVQAAMDFTLSAPISAEVAGSPAVPSPAQADTTKAQTNVSTTRAVAGPTLTIALPAQSIVAAENLHTESVAVAGSLDLSPVRPLALRSVPTMTSVPSGDGISTVVSIPNPASLPAFAGRGAGVAPPLENPVVLTVLPMEGTLAFELTARLPANPIGVASAGAALSGEALAREGLPTPTLRTTRVGPAAVQGALALGVANGIALSHSATQMLLAQGRLSAIKASGQRVDPVTPVVATTLTAEQIQALPLVGRNWQNFVLDTPIASTQAGSAGPAGSSTSAQETTIDGVSTGLAFGGVSGSGPGSKVGSTDGSSTKGMAVPWASGHGAGIAESAIREVEFAAGNAEAESAHAAGGHINVTTHQGGPGFHGQAFLFDRQNTWGARNPFTTWVQETTQATPGTVPGFTAEPYTPPDHETVWGFGAGSEWKRRKLFWFGAIDSYRRNDPALATVKHPYLEETLSSCTIGPCTRPAGFFAQPTNAEAQVLAARLGLPAADPVDEALAAYSTMLETLAGLLGPAPRTAAQWVGFARVDWQGAERHRLTLEAIGGRWNSPGGGLTRVSEAYGNHSLGDSVASEELLMARWEAFLTPNLLAVTQASAARNILATHSETPSSFEQSLLSPSVWAQLPQMVVDTRYGFTIGNPARFGRGSYPDEKLYDVKQSLDWVHGPVLVKAGFELAHNADATTLLRNQTGTYSYANVENFISDALVFAKFGVAGELNANDQHNCDQTGRVWVDSAGKTRGLGNLPCYSHYSQEIGPAGWQMSTNDWAGFATAQWQPARRMVFSAGLRWEREQLPAPIAVLNNPDLPLTQKMPSLGNNWGPRVSVAIGSGESRWPLLRLGYGMYFARTPNQVIETALTQTGSFNGDLYFFMRPTDNLNHGGAPPFPYVLSGAPGSVVKPGAVEFAPRFRNPEVHQAVAAVEERLPWNIHVTASALLSLGRRLPLTVDANIDPSVNPGTITYVVVDGTGAGPIKTPRITVPFYANWPLSTSPTGFGGRLNPDYQQVSEIMSRANSTYEAGMVRVERYGRRGLDFHARYTYAHATDWNPDESSQVGGSSVFDPADFRQEYGTSNLDVRHSAAIIATYTAPWKFHGAIGKLANGWMLSATGSFWGGLPYTMRTSGSLAEKFVATTGEAIVALGPGMNGSGGDNRVYGVGRNTFRYPATWKADMRLGKRIDLGHLRQLELMAETFNLFNHQNVTQLETTGYTIATGNPSGGLPSLNFLGGLKANTTAFGQPLNINATNFFRERQIQVGMRLRF